MVILRYDCSGSGGVHSELLTQRITRAWIHVSVSSLWCQPMPYATLYASDLTGGQRCTLPVYCPLDSPFPSTHLKSIGHKLYYLFLAFCRPEQNLQGNLMLIGQWRTLRKC